MFIEYVTMARMLLALFVVLNFKYQSTWGLILETSRSGNVGIKGGYRIPIDGAPYMAALFMDNEQRCGATIIDDQFVLTSAHCLVDTEWANSTESWRILVGSDQLDNEGVFIDVEEIICHEDYEPYYRDHDICLLKLTENIPFGCFWTVEKMALPEDDRKMYGDIRATVTGWGHSDSENKVSNELRQASVPVVSNDCCRRVHPDVSDYMICAGDKRRNFCTGDAGGPLVANGVLIGVASQEEHCNKFPGVYTKVATYVSWIKDAMENHR